MKIVYELMHGEREVARIESQGRCRIYSRDFMPYNLYLDEEEDIDTLVNNITGFNFWCASRMLSPDRKYAKEILNSIGVSQAVTDKERAQTALSYRCVSLRDIYWVKRCGEDVAFREVNLFDNHLDNTFVDVALRGRQMTVQNKSLARDLSTNGCFAKAWVRKNEGFCLLKDGDGAVVDNEILASRICQCFNCRQVVYREGFYDGERVSVSEIMTSKRYSIVSREEFEIYACNEEINPLEFILQLDSYSFHMMNILDYLIGNTDRHWGNWGLWIDNENNRPVCIHPLMDFNQAFHSYDTVEGANCLTVHPAVMTQREAALDAVRHVGLNQIKKADKAWFDGRVREYAMFRERLAVLSAG